MNCSVGAGNSPMGSIDEAHQNSAANDNNQFASLSTLKDHEKDLKHIGSQFGNADANCRSTDVAEGDVQDDAKEK
jgi:hypothetical protein